VLGSQAAAPVITSRYESRVVDENVLFHGLFIVSHDVPGADFGPRRREKCKRLDPGGAKIGAAETSGNLISSYLQWASELRL